MPRGLFFSAKRGNFEAVKTKAEQIVLTSILAECLQSHRRLVVPGLGAFIVKDPGRCVVFTELLKRDDGILRASLLGRGMDEAAAAGLVDRFVADVHQAVGRGDEVCVPGLGRLGPGAHGTVAFVFDPECGSSQSSRADAPTVRTERREPYSAPIARTVAEPVIKPASEPAPAPATAVSRLPEQLRSAYEDRPLSSSARMSPDSAVRELRYSQPIKTTAAYTYVGDSQHRHHHHHHHRHHRHHRRSRGWLVWVVAILAILIALCAIGYKPYKEWREQRDLDKFLQQNGLTTNGAETETAVPDAVDFLNAGPESEEL